MNPSELSMMRGMVNILNEHLKDPFLTDEQYNIRLEDLRQFEEETGFVLMNSPTCKDNIKSVVKIMNVEGIIGYHSNKCHDIENVIEFSNQKEMLVYPNILGDKVMITYIDGVMIEFVVDNALINFEEIKNVPYKIGSECTYTVQGVLQGLYFYATDIIVNDNTTLKERLVKARESGFDTVPYWIELSFDPKKLKSNLESMFDYVVEEDLLCSGAVFRFNDISYCEDGIIYEMLK